jgi:hypothetical protein
MNPASLIFAALGAYALWSGLRARTAATAAPGAVWVSYPSAAEPTRSRVKRPKAGEPWPMLDAPVPSSGPGVVLGEGDGGTWT